VPFVVLEIDGETPQLCLEYARRILRWLDSIDVPVEEVTVTYTGNQSFHVRLPAGLFGKPIFRSTRVATRTIRELYRMIEDKIGKLGGAHVDGALASPLHHIRAIGSVHEGLYSKGKTRHCVGFRGDELLERSLQAIRQYAVNYSGHTLPDPAEGDTHNQLHELLSEAHSRAQTPESGKEGYAESRGIIDRIRAEGVEKGEEFAPGLVGRNFATRLLSLHLLQSGMSSQDAWNEIKDWNRKNIPPIGEAPDDYASELRYVFEKAQEDAPHLQCAQASSTRKPYSAHAAGSRHQSGCSFEGGEYVHDPCALADKLMCRFDRDQAQARADVFVRVQRPQRSP